tara:strand:+ start:685 stop:813 length:129 start_codon:yes stop_codon:yes gene_type:complete
LAHQTALRRTATTLIGGDRTAKSVAVTLMDAMDAPPDLSVLY